METKAPILADKRHDEASAFRPENLLRESRRQKGLVDRPTAPVCILDPDGDLVRQLKATGRAQRDPTWACYHTALYRIVDGDIEFGIVGRGVERLDVVAASTGSACHTGRVELSPTLAAMGITPEVGMGAVRFSLGRGTTADEIETVIRRLIEVVTPSVG